MTDDPAHFTEHRTASQVTIHFGVEPPATGADEIVRHYLEGRHAQAAQAIHEALGHFSQTIYVDESVELQAAVDGFVEAALYVLTKPDFQITDQQAAALLSLHHVWSMVVAMSTFRNTDVPLRMVVRQPRNFARLLMLLLPRNRIYLDPGKLFDVSPALTSVWYAAYCLGARVANDPAAYDNLHRHFGWIDPRFEVPLGGAHSLYFLVTYLAREHEAAFKRHLHRQIRQRLQGVEIRNRPRPESIAIVTGKWYPISSVYRCCAESVRILGRKYRLTLVHGGPWDDEIDTSPFQDVRRVEIKDGVIDLAGVMENDFQLAFFPDVGMTPESLWLANLRLAPIQAMWYGHPTSTFGAQIDYFIGGAETEIAADADANYSERLVLIPGLAHYPVYPNYAPRNPPRSVGPIRVNCVWADVKCNYPMLVNLKAIQERSGRPVLFHFMPGWGPCQYNSAIPLARDIGAVLGRSATITLERPYDEYMALVEQGDLTLDSYPFGGFTTIVDSLFLAKPTVTYAGRLCYNRVASALLRRLGLDELVATSDREYVDKAVRLINDDDYRRQMSQRIAQVDLKKAISESNDPRSFQKAFEFLIANHERLAQDADRSPIFTG